uniref:Uncharacterized protein n=1 Tax=Oryza brachyantha TaxID=4533 RepID=J3LFT4_ORYBR
MAESTAAAIRRGRGCITRGARGDVRRGWLGWCLGAAGGRRAGPGIQRGGPTGGEEDVGDGESLSVSRRSGSASTARSANRVLALREDVRPPERSNADEEPPHAPLQDGIDVRGAGKAMDTRISPVDMPPTTLATFEVVSILLCVPTYDAMLMSLTRLVTGNRRGLSELQRLDIGLVLSVMAMANLALLEASRRATYAPTSIMWQALPYIMLGAAEVFISVGLIKFYYD